MTTQWRMTTIGLMAATLALAADGGPGLRGPSLGYLYDADARTLTEVLGVPGSSVRGGALSLPDNVVRLRMAPAQDYGLAVLADGSVAVASVVSGKLVLRSLDQAVANPDEIVFSPGGSAAALYLKKDGRLQTLGNFNTTPAVLRETAAADAAALAVSDDARWTAFANADGLALVDAAGSLQRAADLADIAALAFRPGAASLVFTTGKAVYTVDPGSAPQLLRDGLDGIRAVAESADGSLVLARTATGVTLIATADGATSDLACDCEVTSMEAFRGRNVFRLSGGGSGPAYLLDAGATAPRIVFVPGAPPAEENASDGGAQ